VWNFTTISTPTPTPTVITPTPVPTISFNIGGTSTSLNISSSGVIQQAVNITSTDANISLYISAGTIALDSQSQPLDELTMSTIDEYPDPDGNRSVVAAFEFDPDGATFDPGIVVTLHYAQDMIPAGVNESSLVIAFYNESSDSWQYIDGVVDPDANTITFTVNHFTVFTIQTPPLSEGGGLAIWVIVVIVLFVVVVLVLAGVLCIMYKRKRGLLAPVEEGAAEDQYDEYAQGKEDEEELKF